MLVEVNLKINAKNKEGLNIQSGCSKQKRRL